MNDENLMFYSKEDNRAFSSLDEYNKFRADKAEEKRKRDEEAAKEKARQETLLHEMEMRKKQIKEKSEELNEIINAYNRDYKYLNDWLYISFFPMQSIPASWYRH